MTRSIPVRIPMVALGLTLLAPAAVNGQEPRMSADKVKELAARIEPDGYTRAEVCGSCHQDIHAAWADSAHARASTDAAFRAGLQEGVQRHGEGTKVLCLSCHAPTTRLTHSTDLADPLVREGITCDFCHTVKSVDLARTDNPFEMVPGKVKYGPFDYAPSPAHETQFSLLHRNKPTLCAGCHEYRTPGGFAALTTYSEWKAGPYPAQGVSCQDCHMALVQGRTARDDVKTRDTGSYQFINLHRLVGGGSLGQLRRGVDLNVMAAEARGENGYVEVGIVNTAAGHMVPTGLPSKQLVLTVRALAEGKETYSRSRVYERRVSDARGRTIRNDADLFLLAARQLSDNRIAPREKRRETFTFPLRAGTAQAEITLAYRYQAPGEAEPKTLTIAQEIRDLRRK